jgi:RNA-directed DNA polymerase
VQQAILQVLQKQWDPTFSEHSYGFRPHRDAHQAVSRAQEIVAEGHDWVVDIDLEQFFDRVNHDRLMARVAERVTDKRLLKLIRAFLKAGILEDGLVTPTEEGTPQGSPLSPLLSNLVLDELDRELERRGLPFVRYADDCNIYVGSERAGHRVMKSVSDFITRKLRLKVNTTKSAVARPSSRKFLGFSLSDGPQPKRLIAKQSLKRFRLRVVELTGRNRGISLKQMIGELSEYLAGWINDFGFCERRTDLRDLDGWIRFGGDHRRRVGPHHPGPSLPAPGEAGRERVGGVRGPLYQTRQAFSRTIGDLAGQLKAFWNSGMLETTPLTR